jgi:hypothetical protein
VRLNNASFSGLALSSQAASYFHPKFLPKKSYSLSLCGLK